MTKARVQQVRPIFDYSDYLEPNYFKFLIGNQPRLQGYAILLAILTIPLTYATLHIPKIIVDDGVLDKSFPKEVLGFQLSQAELLAALCFLFLFLNIAAGYLKLKLNILVGYISELGMRDLRMTVLKFLHKVSNKDIPASQKSQIIIPEMEAFGGFIGEFLTIPVVQVSTLGTVIFFLFEQSALLGGAALLIIPIQAFVMPRFQRNLVRLKKTRIKLVRNFSNIVEQFNGKSFSDEGDIKFVPKRFYEIITNNILNNRMILFEKKYRLKYFNNIVAKITPFLFYFIGGLLVIRGEITLGTLTAALVAYQQLDAPWRVLIQFYQRWSTTKMQYEQILQRVNTEN